MYVWREITPALAHYLVNANWPSYPETDEVGLLDYSGATHLPTYTCAFTVKLGQR